mgnify:CR=1 FL=1
MTKVSIALSELTEDTRPITYGVVKPGPEDNETGVRFVRGGDVKEGKIKIDELRTITQDVSTEYKRTLLKGGELLISLVGNPGEVALAPVNLIGANIARQVGLVALRPEENSKYVMYFLQSPLGRSRMFQRTQGAVQQVINLKDLREILIDFPSPEKQTKIVESLERYDDLIDNNRRRIALLEESARLLYREWFVKHNFLNSSYDTSSFNDPKAWNDVNLGQVAETNPENYTARNLPEQINYIDISSVQTGRVASKNHMNSEEAPGRARRKIRHGDIIWSNVRPNLKAYSLILNPESTDVCSTGFTVLRSINVPWSFLYLHVTENKFVDFLMNRATGTSYPAVRPDDFEAASLKLPPKHLLEIFHELCEPIFNQVMLLDQTNYQLAKARDLLLPRLMDGRVAV